MEYEGQICRSPMERAAFSLPVTVGCCYNKCYFCNLFKHLQYRELPLDQIEAELRRVSEMGAAPRRFSSETEAPSTSPQNGFGKYSRSSADISRHAPP